RLNKIFAENFAEQGGDRRQAGACQDRQRSYAEFNAIDVKGVYLKLVLCADFHVRLQLSVISRELSV
ncbi:MAG: hypothetical protein IJU73_02850, partial [Ruminococcus sp.]|nr:hypothetical protein [Ruminococcus sp.]